MEENVFLNPQMRELNLRMQERILKSVNLYLNQIKEAIGAERLINLRQIPSGFSLAFPCGIKIKVLYERVITEETVNSTFDFTGILSEHPGGTTVFNYLNISLGLGELGGGTGLFDSEIFIKAEEPSEKKGQAIKIKQSPDRSNPGDVQLIEFFPLLETDHGYRKADIIRQVYLNFSEAHYYTAVSDPIAESLWLVHSFTTDTKRILNYELFLQNFPYTFGSKLGVIPKEESKINVDTQILRLRSYPSREGQPEIIYESSGGPRIVNKEIINLYLSRTGLGFLKPGDILRKILTSQPDLLLNIPAFHQQTLEPLEKYFPVSTAELNL